MRGQPLEWVSVREAARLLDVSTSTVHNMRNDGRLIGRPGEKHHEVSTASIGAAIIRRNRKTTPIVKERPAPEWLGVVATGRILGVHENTVRNMVHDGRLTGRTRSGGKYMEVSAASVAVRLALQQGEADPVVQVIDVLDELLRLTTGRNGRPCKILVTKEWQARTRTLREQLATLTGEALPARRHPVTRLPSQPQNM